MNSEKIKLLDSKKKRLTALSLALALTIGGASIKLNENIKRRELNDKFLDSCVIYQNQVLCFVERDKLCPVAFNVYHNHIYDFIEDKYYTDNEYCYAFHKMKGKQIGLCTSDINEGIYFEPISNYLTIEEYNKVCNGELTREEIVDIINRISENNTKVLK